MPIYAYQCTECRHEVEVLQKISDAPLTDCPSCHRNSLVKKVTAAGFQLKGSGWYVTDFRGNGGGKGKDGKPADGKPAEGEVKPETAKPADSAAAAPKPAEAPPAATPSPAGGSGGPGTAS